MQTKEAIMAYAQSEKAKAGLLMAAQLLEIYHGLPDHDRHGAERFLRPLLGMDLERDRSLAGSTRPLPSRGRAVTKSSIPRRHMKLGGAFGASDHVVQAISGVTTIGQRSMEF